MALGFPQILHYRIELCPIIYYYFPPLQLLSWSSHRFILYLYQNIRIFCNLNRYVCSHYSSCRALKLTLFKLSSYLPYFAIHALQVKRTEIHLTRVIFIFVGNNDGR